MRNTKKMEPDMDVINVRMPKKTIKAIEEESAKLGYANKSEYIREAVRRMINPEIRADVLEELIRRSIESKTDYVSHEDIVKRIRG